MKCLIIGAAGFVGQYLFDELSTNTNWEVFVTRLENETIDYTSSNIHVLDITNAEQTNKIIGEIKPNFIVNLAAQSSVSISWKIPQKTFEVNVIGTINILETLKKLELVDTRLLLIGSSEQYGRVLESELPIKEEKSSDPSNFYAISKMTQEIVANLYSKSFGMNVICVRSFNHFGPKQADTFALSNFCKQIAQIKILNLSRQIYVGDLSAKRDFTDVRDVVSAYRILLQKGISGEIYNVGSGKSLSIKEILDEIIKVSGVEIEVMVDPERIRPIEVPDYKADIQKITLLGWQPQRSIIQTIEDTLNYWITIAKREL